MDEVMLQLFPQALHTWQHLLCHLFSNLLIFPKVNACLNVGRALQQCAAP